MNKFGEFYAFYSECTLKKITQSSIQNVLTVFGNQQGLLVFGGTALSVHVNMVDDGPT